MIPETAQKKIDDFDTAIEFLEIGLPKQSFTALSELWKELKTEIHSLAKEEPATDLKESAVLIVHNGERWYWCKCEDCGWENSSKYAAGGGAIGDTGDYADPMCPVCGSLKIEGDAKYITEEKYGKQVVVIPFNEFIAPYEKTIAALQGAGETSHYEQEAAKEELEKEIEELKSTRNKIGVLYNRQSEDLSTANDEIERLEGLIEKAFKTFHMKPFPHNVPTWEDFKSANNL